MSNNLHLFVVVPHIGSTGPVKGALALCNELTNYLPVTLVALSKQKVQGHLYINPAIRILDLSGYTRRQKIQRYKKALLSVGGRKNSVSLSLCFHADLFNSFMRPYTKLLSSIRGNIFRIYWHEYGWKGVIALIVHLLALRRFDHLTALSEETANKLKNRNFHNVSVIRNFIDEKDLDRFKLASIPRNTKFHFSFLASLTKRKRPDLLIKAMGKLRSRGIDCCLDFYGDGVLLNQLQSMVKQLGLDNLITFHGYQEEPYKKIQLADCMVLPSLSEGTPRAILESLFFGVPCIGRDIDDLSDLIVPGINGDLFSRDEELHECMERVFLSRSRMDNKRIENLLPDSYRQHVGVQSYLNLLESLIQTK